MALVPAHILQFLLCEGDGRDGTLRHVLRMETDLLPSLLSAALAWDGYPKIDQRYKKVCQRSPGEGHLKES